MRVAAGGPTLVPTHRGVHGAGTRHAVAPPTCHTRRGAHHSKKGLGGASWLAYSARPPLIFCRRAYLHILLGLFRLPPRRRSHAMPQARGGSGAAYRAPQVRTGPPRKGPGPGPGVSPRPASWLDGPCLLQARDELAPVAHRRQAAPLELRLELGHRQVV